MITTMKKYIFFYALLILIGVTTYSCDDFFDEKPSDATETDKTLITEKDAQNMINGIYASFMSSSSYGYYLTVLPDLMTDASYAASGYSNQYGDPYSWKIYPGSSELGAVWANHYSALFNANYLINNIEGVSGDEDNLRRIIGEAYAARALLHHNLVRLYAKAYDSSTASSELGVPYVDYNKISHPERNTVEEVYQSIIVDIDSAITLMPVDDEYSFVKDNFSQTFAYGLRARVALDMKDYDNVIDYTSKVIETSYLNLASRDDYEKMFINDEGSEIIFRVGYTATDYGSSLGYNFYNRTGPNYAPRPDYLPADWWVSLLDKYENDIRRFSNLNSVYTDYGWTGNLIYKYPTNPIFDSQGKNMPKPMRMAEMYLMRAEAYSYRGTGDDFVAAMADMNLLGENRIHNFLKITDANPDFLIPYIADERKKELMYEGFYWYDLKRAGKGFTRIPQSNTSYANDLDIKPDDHRWQWPIPTSEINGNNTITQNPGY